MADVLIVKEEHLEDIAEAIREKTGGYTTYLPSQMDEAIRHIDVRYITAGLAEILDKTVNSVNSDAIRVDLHTFHDCQYLEVAKFPKATAIHQYAFYNCPNLVTTYFPEVTEMDKDTFCYCSSLKSISLPKLETLDCSFAYCENLYSVSLPNIKTMTASMFTNIEDGIDGGWDRDCLGIFQGCEALTELDLPKLTKIEGPVFYGSYITSLNAPNLTEMIGGFANSAFKHLVIPEGVKKIWTATFENCANLEILDLQGVTSFQGEAILNCPNLKALILRSPTGCEALWDTTGYIWDGTPIYDGTCYIYVPKALMSSDGGYIYGRWTAPCVQVRAIEDYPEICGEVVE